MHGTHKDPSFHPIFAILFIFFNWITSATSANLSYVSTDKFIVNCGSSESSSFNGKNWTGDVGSYFVPATYNTTSTAAEASILLPSVPKVPYLTARISQSQFTYSFPCSPGLKFIRLHFYPASYLGLNPSNAYFSVSAGLYTLLSNFRPLVSADALQSNYFSKEFCVDVKRQRLNITFVPSLTASDSFAFVNGIEIFSMPPNLYGQGGNVPIPSVGRQARFFIHCDTALEMIYRVNVGYDGVYDHNIDDFSATNIFGTWTGDSSYNSNLQNGVGVAIAQEFPVNFAYNCSIFCDYAAPLALYMTAQTMGSNDAINLNRNLTWSFPVDPGFRYLVRLHFCEISVEVKHVNERVFTVYINNQTAEHSMDLIALTGAPFIPTYRDYTVMVPPGTGSQHDLWISLHPNAESKPKYANVILNGIEIIKLSDSNYNLAAHVQLGNNPTAKRDPVRIIIGGAVGGLAGLVLLCFVVSKRTWQRGKRAPFCVSQSDGASHRRSATMPSIPTSDHCRQFSIAEIRAATNNFDKALIVGTGGFGSVYKGFIDGGATTVAIKRSNPGSHQGLREFQNEISVLSKFRHLHVVSLIGYCQEDDEMILVYEYMAHGTLRDHLYKTQNPPLPWKQRLKICIGAARGLHHLHTGAKHSIIHRDVKTANILLDHQWVAKVSDFGLSRLGPTTTSRGHVSTEVKGTFGYLDPDYHRRRRLTEKSDVYSFGVVLFEVLCARPAVKREVAEDGDEKVGLAEWALHCHQHLTIDRMMDTYLRGKIAADCMAVYTEIAINCLADRGIQRPGMGEVLGNLELALQLQESADARDETNGRPA